MAKKFKKYNTILTGLGAECIREGRDRVLKVELPKLREELAAETDQEKTAELEKRKRDLLHYVLRQNQLLNHSEIIYPLSMKFFEVHSPYYALIKAKTKREAIEKYTEVVADDDGTLHEEIREVERDYALVTFSRGDTEDGEEVSISEILKNFQSDDCAVLLIGRDVL